MDDDNLFDSDMIDGPPIVHDPYIKNIKGKIPWVDKYRPKKLDEVIYQEEVINILNECLKTGQFTHMLLYGPPGSGKTSSIISFVNELFGPNIVNKRVIELNASDERGISVVRNKIMNFAKEAVGNADPNHPSPPFKVIILDEADAMTTEAQSALRTIIESTSNSTRFCFVCNYIDQIIEPIRSRCMKFRFKTINEEAMNQKLTMIAKQEKFDIEPEILKLISEIAKGDVRHGIMMLQYLKYVYDYQGKLTIQDVYMTTNHLPDNYISELWERTIIPKTNITKNTDSNIQSIRKEIQTLREKGYSLHNVIDNIKNIIVKDTILNDTQKSEIVLMISRAEKMLIDGADEYLQLLHILSSIHKTYRS